MTPLGDVRDDCKNCTFEIIKCALTCKKPFPGPKCIKFLMELARDCKKCSMDLCGHVTDYSCKISKYACKLHCVCLGKHKGKCDNGNCICMDKDATNPKITTTI